MSAAAALYVGDAKQAVRMRRFLLATSAYAVCVPLCIIANVLGLVSIRVVAEIGLVAIAVNVVLFALFRTGANERFAAVAGLFD